MKWSMPLFVASIGTRDTADQLVPVELSEWAMTMSLALHPFRKRQSVQVTYTVPAPSISAEGSGPSRRPPATLWCFTVVTVVTALQLAPPFVELNAPIAVSFALAVGTITVPFGATTGWPPMIPALLVCAGPQVSPPSVEVLISIR